MTPADFTHGFAGRRSSFNLAESTTVQRATVLPTGNAACRTEHLVLHLRRCRFSLKMPHYEVREVISGVLVQMPDNYIVVTS